MVEICPVCRNLDPRDFDLNSEQLPFRYRVHSYVNIRIAELAESSNGTKDGCETCQIVDRARTQLEDGSGSIFVILFVTKPGGPLGFVLANDVLRSLSSTVLNEAITGRIYAREDQPLPDIFTGIGTARNIPKDALSPEAMSLARCWLQECTTSHSKCQSPLPTTLPTRILWIGTTTSSIHLLETKSLTGHYATLSHCWGHTSPLTTTHSTLSAHQKNIPFSTLPLTFQQAITVCHALSIKYIWIDSLCIIQDSPTDWLRESTLMQSTYTNAHLNISASTAPNSTHGLSSPIYTNRSLAAGTLTHPSGIYTSRPLHPIDKSGLTHTLPTDVTTTPEPDILSTRAWVLQERMLSPRILHFRSYEMAWECDTHIKCECRSPPRAPDRRPFRALLNSPNTITSSSSPSSIDSEDEDEDQVRVSGHHLSKSTLWGVVLYTYSSLHLTHESDVLAAIKGLADRIAVLTGKRFVLGLWWEDMPWALLWRYAGAMEGRKRRGGVWPSWSWVSLVGALVLQFDGGDLKGEEGEEGFKGHWVRFDDFGRVGAGEDGDQGVLRATGWMAEIEVKHEDEFVRPQHAVEKHVESCLNENWKGTTSIFSSGSYLGMDVGDGNEFLEGSFHILFIALGKNMFFLLLSKQEPSSVKPDRQAYKRIGTLELDKSIVDFERYIARFSIADITLI